jgi:hypothetical protein
MSGVSIIRYLLANNGDLTAVVSAAKISAGVLPLNTALPAISVTKVSANQHNTVSMSSIAYDCDERVQVTVLTKSSSSVSGYAQQQQILNLVRAACPLSLGLVNGFDCQGVLPDLEGPDLFDQNVGVHSQSQDFMVSYTR